jgi:putative membrane protein
MRLLRGWVQPLQGRRSTQTEIEENNPMTKLFVVSLIGVVVAGVLAQAQTSPASAPTDLQIAMIVVTADNIDIAAGKLAATKTSNPKVKEFAELMVRDHTSVNNQADQLAKKLNVTPEESPTSQSLKSEGHKTLAKLRGLSGAAFDKAYIDNEVTYHESVIKAMDDTLIPNAKNSELKALLESGRPIFVSHLDHAKEVQTSLH